MAEKKNFKAGLYGVVAGIVFNKLYFLFKNFLVYNSV